MGAGKSTIARALGTASGLARRGRGRAHRGPRTALGRVHLRPERRALLPPARTPGARRAPAPASRRGGHRRRDVRRGRQPRPHAVRRRRRLARRAPGAGDEARAQRRPPAAGRRSRGDGAALSSAASWPMPRRTSASTPCGPSPRSSNACWTGWGSDAVPRSQRRPRQPRGARRGARRFGRRVGPGAGAGRPGGLWRRSQRGHRPDQGAAGDGAGARAITTRSRAASTPWRRSIISHARPSSGRRECSRRRTSTGWPVCRRDRLRSTSSPPSATARRGTKTSTSSTSATSRPRCPLSGPPLCLFGHTHVPSVFRIGASAEADVADSRRALPRVDRGRSAVSRELRRRRPAARRRPPRGVRPARRRHRAA